ncbi:hypothetical protein E2C01_081658 [Portunus trituberculatus]|uniref:Uncharacterized protein n=1 Tax=Portunus trituberculatus TaxID=210409 RepID=A0A5B7ISG5_PORTR|nr:hypothetical protein [Portunus trituberculatus]
MSTKLPFLSLTCSSPVAGAFPHSLSATSPQCVSLEPSAPRGARQPVFGHGRTEAPRPRRAPQVRRRTHT